MRTANFCVECGERLARKSWRAWLGSHLCVHCAQRLGGFAVARPLITIMLVAIAAFIVGKHMRPSLPPLIIQRAANSTLSDAPVNMTGGAPEAKQAKVSPSSNPSATTDDAVYICGARTKKGTPCHRRVHAAGERCFQHQGMPAILPLEKLRINP